MDQGRKSLWAFIQGSTFIQVSWFSLITLAVLLTIYSYSQVDLNLTLSANPRYLQLQQRLTQLGYFHRDISALIYIVLITCINLVYFLLVYQSKFLKLDLSNLFKIVLIVSVVLTLAYPAFSYDIFNYIFDARLLVDHKVNPYQFTALDFPDDTWTRFMRWTHRTYPYGPTWLPISLLFYIVGLGKFTLTLLSFKLLGLLSFLAGGWGLYTLLKKFNHKAITQGLILYFFNPLLLIEGLVSAHLDMAMAGAMLLGLSWIITKNRYYGWLSLLVSIGIKYVSFAVAPALILFQKKRISFDRFVLISIFLSYVLTLLVISQREILPWYFIVPFSLTALLPNHRITTSLMFGLIPATLVRYAPYLWIGDYTPWVLQIRNLATLVLGVSVFLVMYKLNLVKPKQ